MKENEFDLGQRILDVQIIDVNKHRCGRVDDIEFAGEVGGPLYVAALLTGSGTWKDRLPRSLPRFLRRLFPDPVWGKNLHRIPWEEIDDINDLVELRCEGRELGLGQGDNLENWPFLKPFAGRS
jgi:hypothetical protein